MSPAPSRILPLLVAGTELPAAPMQRSIAALEYFLSKKFFQLIP
jgi:hypothetical protein